AIMRLLAISIFESWPITNVTITAMIGPAASTTRPSVVSPVASLIQPMTYGPTKPPTLPIGFINAMPPAAAEPVRKPVGRDQKVGTAARIRESFSQLVMPDRLAAFALMIDPRLQGDSLVRRQPSSFAGPVGQPAQDQKPNQHRWCTFDDEQPLPAAQAY